MEIFSDERPIFREEVNIHAVLEHCKLLAQAGFGRNVKFIEDYDPSLPAVAGNRDQLVQVILNLLKNAAEALINTPNAEIILTTAFRTGVKIQVSGSQERLKLPFEITIRDNGHGIDEELLPHLFDPFVTTKTNGSGLGLALVAKLIKDHGGIIECESQKGKTLFRILLPLMNISSPMNMNGVHK
jgi:two-component system, NtrC family, nitrogen regulation sensor histidine kinase GlnL